MSVLMKPDPDLPWLRVLVSDKEIEDRIARHEQQFGMSSEKFLKMWRDGTAPDLFETRDWNILLKHRRPSEHVIDC